MAAALGSGFNATAAQNVVFFGATQAAVTAASAGSLTVTVPLGTTYQYPTVTNLATALTAYAAQPFVVTLNGAVAFAPKADAATGTQPQSVSMGDVDGDGKPDLVTANTGSARVSVFRNTGAAGTVSFAAKLDVATGAGPQSVAIGDVDGDGKPDLAVANYYSATVSVLRQVGLPAITSFNPTSGVAGTPVTLTGSNLTGATSVSVNGVAVTPTNVTATSLTFAVPAGASATQSITVTTAGGNTSAASPAFTVRLTVVATGTSPAPNAVTAPVANSAGRGLHRAGHGRLGGHP